MIGLAKLAAEEENPQFNPVPLGIYGAGLGAYGVSRALPMLDGMERVYHGTSKDSAQAIKEQGLLASKAGTGEASIKPNLAQRLGEENVQGKVYATRSPLTAATYAYQQTDGNIPESRLVRGKIPYRDLQQGTVKEVNNPELRGLGRKEWVDTVKNETLLPPSDFELKNMYKSLSAPHTLTVEGDLPTQYIKGSSDFAGQTLSGWKDYVKHNPGRFAKGIGLAGLGTAGIAGGAAVINQARQNKQEED